MVATPFSGKSSMFNEPGKWLTGQVAFDDINDMTSAVNNGYQATGYNPNAGNFGINDGALLNAMNTAMSGAQSRSTPRVQGATIATGPQDQFRKEEMALIDALKARASGNGPPSVAELQMKQGLDRQINAQRAQAASASGVSPGMAARMAAQNIAGAQGQVNADAALLRANESAQAQGMLGSVIGQGRGADINLATNQAGLTQGASLANQQAELQNRAQMDAMMQNLIGQGLSQEQARAQALIEMEKIKAGQQSSTNALNQATAEANAEREQKAKGGILSGLSGVAGMIFSDENLKENVEGADADVDEMLANIAPYSWDYKNPEHGEGRKYGVMAQDLEKSKIGRTLVVNTPDGKAVDTARLTHALIAGLKRVEQRVSKVERKKAG